MEGLMGTPPSCGGGPKRRGGDQGATTDLVPCPKTYGIGTWDNAREGAGAA
jgi:hypothetical protein